MDDVDAFLAEVLPRLTTAVRALHRGDAASWMAAWADSEPISVFGARFTGRGRTAAATVAGRLAPRFSGPESCDYEVVAAGVSGDLGYLAGMERTTLTVAGEPTTQALRVTTVFRREDGEWKVVHRHGDALAADFGTVVGQLEPSG